ncbi:MAG: non-canonical purine NTP pyrophosphatase, partial [Nisaea sp.]
MGRTFSETKLVIASHNQGKLREIRALIGPLGIEVVSAGELGLPEPEETGSTYIANAELKARAAAEGSGLPALADDSGMSVTALDGDPGIYSARWAGPEKDFAMAMQKVEDELQKQADSGNSDRSAAFVCALTICWPDGHTESVEGRVHG